MGGGGFKSGKLFSLFVIFCVCLFVGGAGAQIFKVNFQPVDAPVPVGYLADSGEVFGDKGNGYYYGWNAPTYETIERDLTSEPRYNTFNHLQKSSNPNATWEIALPEGPYDVHIVCGDASFTNQFNTIDVEGTVLVDSDLDNFDEYDLNVIVTDGRLTIKAASGAIGAKICFVDINAEGYFNAAPWVDAGDEQSIIWPGFRTVQLDPEVIDDDPDELDELRLQWSKVSGPGNVSFVGGSDIEAPAARFDAAGSYILRLAATDEMDQVGSDTVTINVKEAILVGDLDLDGDVDLNDVDFMATKWLGEEETIADLDGDSTVNTKDYGILAGNYGDRISPVKISEFMASTSDSVASGAVNVVTRFDDSGIDVYPDWIELHNMDAFEVDLSGWYLTDDRGNKMKWRFPDGTKIGADGYLIVFASDKEEDSNPDNYPFVDFYGALHTNFDLDAGGEYLGLVQPDGTVAHEYNKYPFQHWRVSYGIGSDESEGYLLDFTPGNRVNNIWQGGENEGLYVDAVADTSFSPDRGFYETPFYVTISTDTVGAKIYYTTDSSSPITEYGNPTATARLYNDNNMVRISTTTCLRAAAIKSGCIPTNVDTHTYIFPGHVLGQGQEGVPEGYPTTGWGHSGVDYEVDPDIVGHSNASDRLTVADMLAIPTIVVCMAKDDWFLNGQGLYVTESLDGTEYPCSFEYIDPGLDGIVLQQDCAISMQGGVTGGGTSLNRWKTNKLSMRPRFKRETDNGTPTGGAAKVREALFPDSPIRDFDTIVLDAVLNHSWLHSGQHTTPRYVQDQCVADFHNEMGGYSPHGAYAHVYINELYWGMYYIHERPDHSWAAETFGGMKEEYDAIKHNPSSWINNAVGGPGATSSFNAMLSAASSAGSDPTNASKWETLESQLDVDNLITYLLSEWIAGNHDWPHKNYYATHRLGGQWRYHNWDAEHTFEGSNEIGESPNDIHGRLKNNVRYQLRWADQIYMHFFHNGPLSYPRAEEIYQARVTQVTEAIRGESGRWGDSRSSVPHTRSQWLAISPQNGTYFQNRCTSVFNGLRSAGLYPNVDAPEFNQHGGSVAPGFALEMTGAGTIYYTLDGSDPHTWGDSDPGGSTSVTLVAESAAKRVWVPTGDIGTGWRGSDLSFDDSSWTDGTPVTAGRTGGVGYDENTVYNPYMTYDVWDEMRSKNTSCYIRVPFNVDAGDLGDFNVMTLRLRYEDGFVAYLNGDEIERRNFVGEPDRNSRANDSHSDTAAVNFIEFPMSSSDIASLRAGANVLAIHGLNESITSSDFLVSVELIAGHSETGGGNDVSPSAVEYDDIPVVLDSSVTVNARALNGGEWSALHEATFAVGSVAESLRITEVMYHPEHPPVESGLNEEEFEYVELQNIGGESINLSMVSFVNGIDYTFDSLEVAAGEYVLLVKNETAFRLRYLGFNGVIADEYLGGLDNDGDRIELVDAGGTVIHNFRYGDGWFDITDGGGFSLTIRDPLNSDPLSWDNKAGWRPSASVGGTPGWSDSGQLPELGSIVINEILAHSHAIDPDWIELHNTTDSAISIGGWFLSDSEDNLRKYEIAADVVVPGNGYVVFYEDDHFGNPSDPGCDTPFAFSENGDELYLHSGQDGVLTGYSDEEDFGASETNIAFGRYQKSTGTFNFVAMSSNTPLEANTDPKVGPVVISEIMYHPAGNDDAEYVELRNISGASITLFDPLTNEPWRFTDDGGFEYFFPTMPALTLAVNERILLVKNETAFEGEFNAAAGTRIFEWGSGSLGNGGERIQLSKPGDIDEFGERQYIRVDRVVYDDELGWPVEADAGGKALDRRADDEYGNDVANWRAVNPTPGSP